MVYFTAVHRTLQATAFTIAALAFGAAAAAAQSSTVHARDAWVREAPAGRTVSAAFLVLENTGAERALVRGSTESAESLELHEMRRDGAMMSMAPVKSIVIPAKGRVELKPGGLHLMLFGVKRPLLDGDSVSLRLQLDDGSTLTVPARVRRPQGMP
jgi:periplasmic copper chaperone A